MCPKSYGLHVAALAGVPRSVCSVAADVGDAFEARISRRFKQARDAGALTPAHDAAHAAVAAQVEVAAPAASSGGGIACFDDDDDMDGEDLELGLLMPLVEELLCGSRGGVRDVWTRTCRLLPALGVV
jgi:hypothetical protein